MQFDASKAMFDGESDRARARLFSRRGEPLFLADWDRVLFLHYEVEAAALQAVVPFALDLREGKAFVSLVAFTLRGMRLRFGGRAGAWLCRPMATHAFLNVRTYVRHLGEPGIFFLAEWLTNPLCIRLGPCTYRLPYRAARITYDHAHESGTLIGKVVSRDSTRELRYRAVLDPDPAFRVSADGSLDAFLLERYTAFTSRRGRHGFFRIWHRPWEQVPVVVEALDAGLLTAEWPCLASARCIGANYSPGAQEVSMGWPHRTEISRAGCRSGVLSAALEFP